MLKGGYGPRTPQWRAYRHEQQERTIIWKNGTKLLLFNPRIGICNYCCAVVGVNCKHTHIHHERYDDSDPLKYMVELCPACHVREGMRLRQIVNANNNPYRDPITGRYTSKKS